MKLGLEVLAPVQVAFVRLAICAAALIVLSAVTGQRLPRKLSTWRHLFVVAMLVNSIPFTLFAFGETQISSVLAGIINAGTPLTTLAVILLAFPEEKPTLERVFGLVVGFLGILTVVGVWEGLGSGEWIGIAACLGAVTCYGVAFPYVRRHLAGLPESGVALATGQVICGAAVLLPLGVGAGPLHGPITVAPVLGMLGLGALGSGFAFVLNYQIARGRTLHGQHCYVSHAPLRRCGRRGLPERDRRLARAGRRPGGPPRRRDIPGPGLGGRGRGHSLASGDEDRGSRGLTDAGGSSRGVTR